MSTDAPAALEPPPTNLDPDAPAVTPRIWQWWLLVAGAHAALFFPWLFRAHYRPDGFDGPNLYLEHAQGYYYPLRDWWRPGTPGWLYHFSNKVWNDLLPGSDIRLGALLACLMFQGIFGVALFEVFRRPLRRTPGLALPAAAVTSLLVALLESPAGLVGWARFITTDMWLPLYLPFVPTTLASLGLNVLAMLTISDLLKGDLPRSKRWQVPTLTVLASMAKPTLIPLLIPAVPVVAWHIDRKRRLPDGTASHEPVLGRATALFLLPAITVVGLQFLTTVYKVQYKELGYDDRGGWVFRPLEELRYYDALTPLFFLLLLLPLAILVVLGKDRFRDTSVLLSAIATAIGFVIIMTLARDRSTFRGDTYQLLQAPVATLLIFQLRDVLALWRERRLTRIAAVAIGIGLALYALGGGFSWMCRSGIGCPAIY